MGAGFTPARTKGGRWDEMHGIALVESLAAAGQPSAAAAQYGEVGRSECVERMFFFFFFYKNEIFCFFKQQIV